MFNPVENGLEPDFQLTKFSTLRGWGCKIPQDVLIKYLAGTDLILSSAEISKKHEENEKKKEEDISIGAGMDSAIIPLTRHKNLFLVQTVDFFYPLLDDPKTMGKIALANVLSDVYAVGVTKIDRLSLIVSCPTEFTDKQRDIILPLLFEGFNELAKEANCKPSIQNIAVNPWCIIGGIASSVCSRDEIIAPVNATSGDVIVLTKPIGTQISTNAYIWMQENNEKYIQIKECITNEEIKETFLIATKSMSHLNKIASELMHKYNAHAATDVTGFGLVGHAQNLAEFQKAKVDFIIKKLPIIKNAKELAEIVGQGKKLLSGKAVETSGGLLICMPKDHAEDFCEEYQNMSNSKQAAWIIGDVIEGNGNAQVVENPEIINVKL